MKLPLASTVLMIRPSYFDFNPETAKTNTFQNQINGLDTESLRSLAIEEFNNFVSLLEAWDIEVLVFEDSPLPHKPDAVFPNNWISTHYNGWLITYPMLDLARRNEQREDIILTLCERYGYVHRNDLKALEASDIFLEGTGSLVLDRNNQTAYAAISPRTDILALEAWSKLTGFKHVPFRTSGPEGSPIYHTNVMMCIADNFAIIGADTIIPEDRNRIVESLRKAGKELLLLSNEQVFGHFAGNMLALQNKQGERLLVMSAEAKRSLSEEQIQKITQDWGLQILAAPLSVIETVGGGSARCMLAEIVQPL